MREFSPSVRNHSLNRPLARTGPPSKLMSVSKSSLSSTRPDQPSTRNIIISQSLISQHYARAKSDAQGPRTALPAAITRSSPWHPTGVAATKESKKLHTQSKENRARRNHTPELCRAIQQLGAGARHTHSQPPWRKRASGCDETTHSIPR